MGEPRAPVRSTADPRRVEAWALVLSAKAIPFEVRVEEGRYCVWTDPSDAPRASRELAAYDEENRPEPPRPRVPRWGRTATGAVVGWLLVAGYGATSGSPELVERGSARAERVIGAEPWRAVTALTLHADLPHVLGNAAAAGVFLTLAGWRLGPGAAVALSLAAGALGNVLAALLSAGRHDAIGASTAMFATLGLVTAIALHDARRYHVRRRAPWVLGAASLALLGLMGAGEGSDVLAHATGWSGGIGLGLPAVAWHPRPLPPGAQCALAAASVGVVAGAWWLAIR